jgi:hypothetical protein
MNDITLAEQQELDALLAKERQSSDQQELDALLRKERQAMVSRIANPEATREERMQSMREMRGGGGPMSLSAETTAAKYATYAPSIIAGIATGGSAPLVQAGVGGLTALTGATTRQVIENVSEDKPFRPREILGEAVTSSFPTLKGVPLSKYIPFLKTAPETATAYRAANLALNTGIAGTGAVTGGAVSGSVTDLPSAVREALVPTAITGGSQLLGDTAGEVSKVLSRFGKKAETVEKAGITPLFSDVWPEAAAFAQRAQSKISSGTLRQLEDAQLQEIEQAALRIGGVEGVGQPGDVKRVYQDAVALLGLNKVQDITGNSKDFSSATQALNGAVEEAKSYAKQLSKAEQEAYSANSAQRIADTEAAYNNFVEGLGVKTEREIQSKLGPRIASAETRATESAFPSGVPRAADTAQRGFQIQDLITQPAEGKPPGLKQITDDFFEQQYGSIPVADRVFKPNIPIGDTGVSLIDKARELKASIPKTGMPGLEDIIRGAMRTEKVPIGGTGGMASRDVISNFSLGELREVRRNIENWAYSKEAYGTPAKAKAKEFSNYITTMINEQAPQVFQPQIAQQLLDTNKKYAQVRQLWENPLVESAFAGVKATPEKMLERIGASVVKSGASASDYRGITDLMDNLKAIGVEGVPDRSEINNLVQQYIATKSLGANGKLDNQKLLGYLNGIERTSPGSMKKLGFGDIADLENFDVVKGLVNRSTNQAGDVDYRNLLTKLSVMGSEDPSKLKALGLGTIQDIDSLNRIAANMGEEASTAAKAREFAKSDTLAGYQVSERILGLLDDSKDIKSVMSALQEQVVSGSTPQLRKQASQALVNTRASAVEDLLFGRTAEGVSGGARNLDFQRLKDTLKDRAARERYTDILGSNLISKIENELMPGLEIINQRKQTAGGAGQSVGGTAIEKGATALIKGPLAVGSMSASAILSSGQGLTKGLVTGALSAALYSAMEIGGPALASKVLARTVGATGLKNKAAAAAELRTLIDRVNRAPNREAALGLLSTYASSGSVPEE